MDYGWGATAEENLVKQSRCEGLGFTVWEGENKNSFCKTVDDSKGFGFACSRFALALKIHSIPGTGLVGAVSGEHAVR
jgi:hypothetical protein